MAARPIFRAPLRLCLACRNYATTPTTPPMLLKIRDMKSAMQAKDANRLSVLRALLAQALNASKTSSPINTDLQMLALLRKTTNASRQAGQEFRDAGRPDLADKEESQVQIMEEYAGGVETVGEEEIRARVREVVTRMRAEVGTDGVGAGAGAGAGAGELKMGEVLKKVFAPDVLGERPVEKGEVAKIVKQELSHS